MRKSYKRRHMHPQGECPPQPLDGFTIEQEHAMACWVAENLKPRKTPLIAANSYFLKHHMQSDLGPEYRHMTEAQFKWLMLGTGYDPVYPRDYCWHYRVSKTSPVFLKCNHRIPRRHFAAKARRHSGNK